MAQPHIMRTYHFLIALLVVALDRASKWVVMAHISLHDGMQIIPGFFRLSHEENRGAAFSLFADSTTPWKTGLLIAFSVVALVVVSVLLWKNNHAHIMTGIALSLIWAAQWGISGTGWRAAASWIFCCST